MHRAQKKGIQEQQESDEEAPAPSPAPTQPRLPVVGPSNPCVASSLPDIHLGKRKAREMETIDSLLPYKRPQTNRSTVTRTISPRSVQTITPTLSSPSKCSTPIPQLPLPIPTSMLRSSVAPLLLPTNIHQSPVQSRCTSTDDQSGTPFRTHHPTALSLVSQPRNRLELINVELSLEFSGDEQEEEQQEQEAKQEGHPIISSSKRNEIQSANGDEDSDKTESDTNTEQDWSETSDDSQVGMDTQDYAMPWRRCLSPLPSPPYDRNFTESIQRGNEDQVLVPASQSTNSQSTVKLNSQALSQQPQLRLPYQAEAGPSRKGEPGTHSVTSTSPFPRKEQEMDPDTSCVPDSQDDISLLGPPSRLNGDPSSSLPSGVPESSLSQPGQHLKLRDEPLLQPSQPSQLTDPDFVPGTFDEYTDPLEFTIGAESEPEVSLDLNDEVTRLGGVVHYEDAGYALRDRDTMQRSESGASMGTDVTTLVGDYFEAEEEIKEAEKPQESQLTWTEGSQGQDSQPLSSESQASQVPMASAPIQLEPSKSVSRKLQHLQLCVNSLSSVQEERKNRLIVAVLDLIAHWLKIKDVKLIHDIWDSLSLHERTFDHMLRVCLQCDLTVIQTQTTRRHPSRRRTHIGSSDDEEDVSEEEGQSIGLRGLRQRYMIVPDPKRRFPYPKGRDPGHAWMKVICRTLGAMYGFKAQHVHQLWTETGGEVCEVERQLEARRTGWLDLRELGLGDVPRPWV